MQEGHDGLHQGTVVLGNKCTFKPLTRDVDSQRVLRPGPEIMVFSLIPDLGKNLQSKHSIYVLRSVIVNESHEGVDGLSAREGSWL